MGKRRNIELWLSLIAIILITLLYLGVAVIKGSIPAARSFFGHSLGVIGFLMMIFTETLYSLRKRSRNARWGRMSRWLEFHIFTGLVGPYLVLLHTSWRFNGLAGVLMLLTVIIVGSGFIGRYIYTAVPRTADGMAMEASQLETMINEIDAKLRQWRSAYPDMAESAQREAGLSGLALQSSSGLVLGRAWVDWQDRKQADRRIAHLDARSRAQAKELERLVRQRKRLGRQVASLAVTRRMLAVWHTVHIPIGVALFTVSIFHIVGAIYYATLLR